MLYIILYTFTNTDVCVCSRSIADVLVPSNDWRRGWHEFQLHRWGLRPRRWLQMLRQWGDTEMARSTAKWTTNGVGRCLEYGDLLGI